MSTVSAEPARKRFSEATGINPDTRVKDLTDEEEAKIRECIDHHYVVEGDLRRGGAGHQAPYRR